jgi:hypothetical protein
MSSRIGSASGMRRLLLHHYAEQGITPLHFSQQSHVSQNTAGQVGGCGPFDHECALG